MGLVVALSIGCEPEDVCGPGSEPSPLCGDVDASTEYDAQVLGCAGDCNDGTPCTFDQCTADTCRNPVFDADGDETGCVIVDSAYCTDPAHPERRAEPECSMTACTDASRRSEYDGILTTLPSYRFALGASQRSSMSTSCGDCNDDPTLDGRNVPYQALANPSRYWADPFCTYNGYVVFAAERASDCRPATSSFDYDCNGRAEKRWEQVGRCDSETIIPSDPERPRRTIWHCRQGFTSWSGWDPESDSPVPPCGVEGRWQHCRSGSECGATETRIQECR